MQPSGNTHSTPAEEVETQPDSAATSSTEPTASYAPIQAPDAVVGGLDLSRQVLTKEAGVAGLATVLESDLRPRSELEAMLGDQLAAAHNAALRLLQAASTRQNPETAVKLTGMACRVMSTFQEGLVVMHRLRHGDQGVVVQHVRLSDNAQAIVTGDLNHAGE